MSEHPPPAPDWILGEDGHWKPPPFQVGGRPTAPPPPAPPGTAPSPPPGGWAPPPGGAPAWGPPPIAGPPTGPSAGRVVAWVVGGFAVAGVAVVGILATAVVFLGTTAEPEARFTPVGSSLPDDGDGDGDGDGTFTPIGGEDEALDTPSEPTMTESMETVDFVYNALTDAWIPTGGEELPVEIEEPDACAPDGWLDGANDRYRTYWDRPGGPVTDALTLSLTAYADEAAAAADLVRARTPEYQACETEQAKAEFAGATDARLQALPDDPAAPGVTYQVDVVGIERPTEYDFTVVVGHLRAHLDFCGCVDMDLEAQRQVARDVALALADAQDLPAPG